MLLVAKHGLGIVIGFNFFLEFYDIHCYPQPFLFERKRQALHVLRIRSCTQLLPNRAPSPVYTQWHISCHSFFFLSLLFILSSTLLQRWPLYFSFSSSSILKPHSQQRVCGYLRLLLVLLISFSTTSLLPAPLFLPKHFIVDINRTSFQPLSEHRFHHVDYTDKRSSEVRLGSSVVQNDIGVDDHWAIYNM